MKNKGLQLFLSVVFLASALFMAPEARGDEISDIIWINEGLRRIAREEWEPAQKSLKNVEKIDPWLADTFYQIQELLDNMVADSPFERNRRERSTEFAEWVKTIHQKAGELETMLTAMYAPEPSGGNSELKLPSCLFPAALKDASGNPIPITIQTTGESVMVQVPPNNPILAPMPGAVIFRGDRIRWGKTIILDHPGNIQTLFGGVQNWSVDVGDWVQPGQAIGAPVAVKNDKGQTETGFVLEIRINGKPVDPLSLCPAPSTVSVRRVQPSTEQAPTPEAPKPEQKPEPKPPTEEKGEN